MNKYIASGLATISMLALMMPKLALADTPVFLSGDIMTGTNNTTGNGTWSDPVSANPGEVIEMRIVAQNQQPNSTADNVVVTANLPQTVASTITATGTVSADNASPVSDTLTVNILGGTQQAFGDVVAGHTRVFDNSCPSGCFVADTIMSGVNVGNLGPGESAQVLFKVYITNIVASPSPSPSTSPSPSPSPSVSPSPSTTTQSNSCANGTVSGSNVNCSNNIGGSTSVNQNITNTTTTNTTSAAPTVVTTAATPARQLPQTGAPLAALALGGLLPGGLSLRKFGKSKDSVTPLSLIEEREQKKLGV